MALTFILRRASVMSYTHAKDRGQRSVGLEGRVKTHGQMDITDRITFLANDNNNKPTISNAP